MKNSARLLALALSLALVLSTGASAQRLRGQAVTYTDFSYVTAVTSSLNRVYFATTGGIIVYDTMADRWDQPLTGADGLLDEVPTRLWVDKFDQKLYAQTDLGLYEYDDFFERWYPINELPEIDNDVRQVGPPQVLMPQFDANYMGNGRFIDNYGRSFTTTSIVRDNSGHYWIGTRGFGPAVADDASGLMKLLPYGLLQRRVNTILPDDSVLWLSGTIFNDFRTGLTAYNPEENSFRYVESGLPQGLPADDVYCMEADDDYLYVGTPFGLYTVERGTLFTKGPLDQRRGLSDDIVLSLKLFGDSLFVGTEHGLSLISLATDSVYTIQSGTFGAQEIYDMEVVDSTIWIASSGGAFRYTPASERLYQYKDPDLVLFNAVFNIESYGSGLWLASDAGVVRLDLETGRSTPYRDMMNNARGRALAVNDRIMAISSDRGMTIFFLDRKKRFSREFTVDDGLASDVVYSLLLDGDYIWVGTDEGLTRFWWNNPNRVD
jgi:ligand-binding sensor domain-containing protein